MQRPSKVYQILVMFLYGEYPWLERYEDGIIEFKFRYLSKSLGDMRYDLIRHCLRWLKQYGFISVLEIYTGAARFKLAAPRKLFDHFDVVEKNKKEDEEDFVWAGPVKRLETSEECVRLSKLSGKKRKAIGAPTILSSLGASPVPSVES